MSILIVQRFIATGASLCHRHTQKPSFRRFRSRSVNFGGSPYRGVHHSWDLSGLETQWKPCTGRLVDHQSLPPHISSHMKQPDHLGSVSGWWFQTCFIFHNNHQPGLKFGEMHCAHGDKSFHDLSAHDFPHCLW